MDLRYSLNSTHQHEFEQKKNWFVNMNKMAFFKPREQGFGDVPHGIQKVGSNAFSSLRT
jgi:hypothetical protein